MAWLGLIKKDGNEVDAPDYHRIDVTGIAWLMSVRPYAAKNDLEFVNGDEIKWPAAKTNWGRVKWLGFFSDFSGPPIVSMPFKGNAIHNIRYGDIFLIPSQKLSIDSTLNAEFKGWPKVRFWGKI